MRNSHPFNTFKKSIKFFLRLVRRVKNSYTLGTYKKTPLYHHVCTYKSERKYTVISAVYRVENYINDMMFSLIHQTLDFKRSIQVILIDDGSDDRSSIICKLWVDKFPENVVYVRKNNGGQSTARNIGLNYAQGEWVTFIDPDDIVDKNYFFEVDKAIEAQSDLNNLSLISCNVKYYVEEGSYLSDSHPLNYRFRFGQRRVVFDDNCNDIQLSVSTAFFKRKDIIDNEIKFKDVRPNAEDLNFVADYLMIKEKPEVLYIPEAIYWYRKRSDCSSSLDTCWEHEGQYTDVLRNVCLELLNVRTNKTGLRPPYWIQRTILYHLIWHIRGLVNSSKTIKNHYINVKNEYLFLIKEILKKIDPETIKSFELASATELEKYAMLSLAGATDNHPSPVECINYDSQKSEALFSFYFSGIVPEMEVTADHKIVKATAHKIRTHTIFGEIAFKEFIAWYPVTHEGCVNFQIKHVPNVITSLSLNNLPMRRRENLNVDQSVFATFPVKIYKLLSQTYYYKKRYYNAWLFIDRDTQADDNAEHLYRFIKLNHQEKNTWFILRKESHDWARLEKEGFRLIPFGSLSHKMALLNAQELISSHADHYITNYLDKKKYFDLIHWNYTFLQHGVTKDDLSHWFNTKTFTNLITSTPAEFTSLCIAENSYKFTPKEVALTGFPRHDRLLNLNWKGAKKRILIMPTWRENLVGKALGNTNNRGINSDFTRSIFHKNWNDLIASPKLKQLSDEYGYELIFFPHVNIQPYINVFDTENVKVLTHHSLTSIQELFASSEILITDYSSVAFEMAYLERSVLYFHFDENIFVDGSHFTKKGYFDYETDGFGPIFKSSEEILEFLVRRLRFGDAENTIYKSRMKNTFPFRDGHCCQRVYNRILLGLGET